MKAQGREKIVRRNGRHCRIRQDWTASPAGGLAASGVGRKPSRRSNIGPLDYGSDQPDRRQRTIGDGFHSGHRRHEQLSGGIRSTISLALALGTGTRGWLRLWESVEHGRTKHSQQGEEEAELYLVREAICPTDNYRLLIVNIILPTSALEDSCNRSVSITSYLQYKRIVLAGDYSYRLARRLAGQSLPVRFYLDPEYECDDEYSSEYGNDPESDVDQSIDEGCVDAESCA